MALYTAKFTKNAKHSSNYLCDLCALCGGPCILPQKVNGQGRTLTSLNPNKVWLDVYPGVFNGSLLKSYEVVVRNDKVESYREGLS